MENSTISSLLTAMLAHLLAVISPGPDFILITKNSLIHSRKIGVYSAFGLGLGILVHVTYSLVGIGLLISKSVVLFTAIKLLGALYLLNIGYQSLRSHSHSKENSKTAKMPTISKNEAIKMGFITNVTNPKASLFFLSLFTLVVKTTTPLSVKLFLGIEMSLVTFLWFALVATVLSHHYIKERVDKIQLIAEKVMGAILVIISLNLIVSVIT